MKVACLVVFMCIIRQAESYPQGPPPEACEQMFPSGHHKNSQTSPSPVSITSSEDKYKKKEQVTVTVNLTNPNVIPYFKGMFIQARRANCGNAKKFEPVGTWKLGSSTDDFLKLFTCNNTMSAISQKVANGQTMKQMIWIAPDSNEGPVYFTATIVRSKDTFWTNVRSGFVADNSNPDLPKAYCDLQSTQVPSFAEGIHSPFAVVIIAAAVFDFTVVIYCFNV